MILDAYKVLRALITRRIEFDVDLIPLSFDGLSLKRILNWALTEASVHVKPAKPWGFPTIFQIEPTARCNLRCRVCPVATGRGRPSGDMDWGLFKSTLDELGEYLLVILFWDWGEPFLNPNAYEMIRYARRWGIKVMASTNGHIFVSTKHAREVVESGLDVLIFSVDGITQETYQHYRAAGNLQSVFEGIRNVMDARTLLKSKRPFINFRFIVMKHNEKEIPQLEAIGRSLGVDALTLRKFYAIPNRWQEQTEIGSEFLPSNAKYQLPEYSPEDLLPTRIARNPCRNLWNCPTMHWDGTVCSCFMDFNEQRPLGSLKRQSFREIWYGQAFRNLRKDFRKRWEQLALCGECSSGFKGGDVGRASNAEIVLLSRT